MRCKTYRVIGRDLRKKRREEAMAAMKEAAGLAVVIAAELAATCLVVHYGIKFLWFLSYVYRGY